MLLPTRQRNRFHVVSKRALRLLAAFSLILALHLAHPTHAAENAPEAVAQTVITIDTSEDLENGSSAKTCTYTQGPYVAAGDGCTLRRALIEASARPQGDRPILIQFNLPNNDPNHNLEVNGTWTIEVGKALPPLKTDTILNLNGQVFIDGDSQPGIRTTGPGIIVDSDFSLEIESENNLIENLAFKGGGAILLKGDHNTVNNIWMGLSDDGQAIALRDPGDPKRLAGGGIVVRSNENHVTNNHIAGAFGPAISIDGGDDNLVEDNVIGTRADGTIPDVPEAIECLRSFSFDPANWYGGWGIATTGSNNTIQNNLIAGLHILQSQNDTPPIAIEIFGAGHTVQDNSIGVDSNEKIVGVCGQGIKVSGHDTQIVNNLIAASRTGFQANTGSLLDTAILASDSSPLFGQITVRRNLIVDGPGTVYAFGPKIPEALRLFEPALITEWDGAAVTGASGAGSPCPNCVIDFYADDLDGVQEALTYLGSITATVDGSFTGTLTLAPAAGQGIRTNSTAQSSGVIGSLGAGTSTRLSKLFYPMSSVAIAGPATGEVNVSQSFTVTVAPPAATTPFSYTVEATDAEVLEHESASNVVLLTYTWPTPGVKTIEVTVTNDLGTVTTTFEITIMSSGGDGTDVFLPMIRR